jgi:hypothetical protein
MSRSGHEDGQGEGLGNGDRMGDAVGDARAGRSAATPVFAIGATATVIGALFLVALLLVVAAYLVGR